MAQSCDPPSVWAPFGAFSQIVVSGQGRLVLLKGQVSLDRDGTVVGVGDMSAQVQQVLENVRTILAEVGGHMSDVVSLTQYTTDISAFMQAGVVRQAFFRPPYPVTTTVEVSALYDPALLVEITAIAEVPVSRFRQSRGAREMHQAQ